MGSEPQEIRTGAQTDFQFCRLLVRLDPRSSQTYPGKVGSSELQNQFPPTEDQLFGETTHVLDRPAHSNRKTGFVWASPHETHPMAPEEPLAQPGIVGEDHPDSQVPSSPPALVVKGGKHPSRPTLAPPSSRGSDLYRRIKRRLGHTFRGLYHKRPLVRSGKQTAYQFPVIESSFIGPKGIQTSLLGSGGSGCHQQYYRGGLHKEEGMRSGSLCALLWRLLSWCNLREICLRVRHIPGRLNVIADKLSRHRQVIQTEWSLHQDVFAQICHRWHLLKVALFATRYNCKLPQFVSPVPNPKAWAVDALSLS